VAFYNPQRLFLAFLTDAKSFKGPAQLTVNGAEWAEEQGVPQSMRSILNDDRMEAFLWPSTGTKGEYFAFEVNKGGRAVVSRTQFLRKFDFLWKTALCQSLGSEDSATQVESHVFNSTTDKNRLVFAFAVEFADLGLSVSALEDGTQTLKCGLYRATRVDDTGAEMAWASWVDPNDEVVDFHRPETFGTIAFRP